VDILKEGQMEENKVNEKEAKKGNVIKFFLGLSKKAKIIIGVAILVLIAGFVIFGINRHASVDTVFSSQILTKSSELTTAKLKIQGISDYHDEGLYVLNRSDFTMRYCTTIRAGINLENVKIEADSFNKKIYITLPEAEIFEAKVDPNDIKFYGAGFALFNVDEKEDLARALAAAEKDAMEYAKTTGILELANQQSETLVKGILANAIPSGYTIEFRK
jgi:hypothetical protein